MISEKKLLTEWIPDLQRKFQGFMPPIDKEYPKIYSAREKEIEPLISEIYKELELQEFFLLPFNLAEFMHGKLGDAILIYTRQITSEDLFPNFARRFWTQLGYFYLINIEPREWFDFYSMSDDDWDDYTYEHEDDDSPEYEAKYSGRYGYRVWHSFAAETIAELLCLKYLGDMQPKTQILLDGDSISEEDTGRYLAWLFVRDIDDSTLPMSDNVRHFWNELKKIIEPQYHKDSFWLVDEKIFQEIGDIYMDFELQFTRKFLIKEQLNQYHHVHVEPIAPTAAELKKKQKSKRKAQKQARKKNRR